MNYYLQYITQGQDCYQAGQRRDPSQSADSQAVETNSPPETEPVLPAGYIDNKTPQPISLQPGGRDK